MPPLTTRAKVLLALVIVAGFILAYDLLSRKERPQISTLLSVAGTQIPLTPISGGAAPDPMAEERWKAIQERARLSWGRDPFRLEPSRLKGFQPEGPKEPPLEQVLKVTGIVWNGRHVYAVINDFLVKKGDEIVGAKVIEIKQDHVILLKDGREHILRLVE
ncbi:MAG: hypothetical protein HY347_08195 [candidate division NC10 bacterium]|nr:hypothetical protein [candidate division NC10 bacterium]